MLFESESKREKRSTCDCQRISLGFPGQQFIAAHLLKMFSVYLLRSINLRRFLRAVSLVVVFLLPVTPAFSAEADLSWTDLSQEYDGQEKSPLVTTEPPNLEVTLEYFPRSNSEVLFQRIPEIDQPSYPSYGLNGKSDIGLGDLVDLEIDNQRLESVDVVMVNFAQAANWPQLAEENSEGYFHPLTLTIYRVLGDDLFLVTEKTQDFLIPWRPATLDDGGEYPYGGRAFRARFNFTEEKFLAGNLALVISYNTNQGGPAPLGVAGPYDTLNVALNDDTPLVGSDDNPSRVVRQTASRIYQSGAFGMRAPMFVVRGFPASPATGQPIEAGGYLVRATVDDGDFTAEAYENFEITPQEVELDLLGVRQVADGSPKTIEVAEIPEGSSLEVVFAKRDDLPVEEGLYPFFVRLRGGNFSGSRSGVMRLVAEEGTSPLVITSISTATNGDVSLRWNSREGQTYAILAKDDLNESDISLWDELDGNIESQGASTTAVISSVAINSITDTGKIFFRVRRQR